MTYEYVKAACLFCDATVEGNQRYMLGGKTFFGKRGAAPEWLKEKPEHKWVWNGLGNAIFYLCPDHADDEHYEKAFEWAKKHDDETSEKI
jgi:hypothetical protein